jgi:nitrite reductase/ring-hydroxylating ferredoxin subunit
MSVDVGAVEDFTDRNVELLEIDGREIGVVRWDDEFYALANVCSHQRGPLCRGALTARLTASAPGTMRLDEEAPVLACPWHGWEFDVRTGRAIWDERFAVRTYAVEVEHGRVLIDLSRRG